MQTSWNHPNEGVESIQGVDVRDPQMHKIWRLGSDGITREVYPKAQVDIGAGTMGQFSYDYLAENGWRIPILGQISINGSVKMLGIPNLCRTSGPMFIENLLAPHDTTGWGDDGTPNQSWLISPGGGLTVCGVFPVVVLSLPILLTCPGVRRTRALMRAVSVITPFVVGVVHARGVPPQVVTLSGI